MMFAMQYNVHKKTRRVIFYIVSSPVSTLSLSVFVECYQKPDSVYLLQFFFTSDRKYIHQLSPNQVNE